MFKVLDDLIQQQRWLDTLAPPLQNWVNSIYGKYGAAGKSAKNFLNGTWLGHPLHPVITDVPVGAWTSTFVLDAAGSMTGRREMQKAADITLAVGLLAAGGAAITGWTDWSDTYGKDRKVGLAHGLTMAATVAVYSAALGARLAGARGMGSVLTNTGFALMSAGAYLGGDEVFDLGYGINRTAYESGPSDFVYAMSESELQPDTPTRAEANGVSVVLVKQGDAVYALSDTCVHAGCSLAGGTVEGRSIICPCHGSQYDLSNGAVINGPATMPEPAFEVRIRNGVVEVKGT